MSPSRPDMPAGWAAAPAFHPEFGFLSPYASKRRGIPAPVLLIAGGIAVSATIGFASEHWGEGGARTTTVERIQAPAAKSSDICTTTAGDDSEASFLSSICGGRLHARHGGHARLSTVVLGRTALPSKHVAAAPIPSATPTPEASAKVNNEKSEKAPERVAAAKKPKAKSRTATIAAQARELERQNAFDAFASARPGLAYAPRPMPQSWAPFVPAR